jgi:hypothetical protein
VTDINTLPQEVNIDHYAGDTLTIHVIIDSAVVAGRTWKAQVRTKAAVPRIDAEFGIIPTAEGVDLVLYSTDSLELARRGPYTGMWDVQLAEADGSDPVTTIAYGEIRLHPDVTRISP